MRQVRKRIYVAVSTIADRDGGRSFARSRNIFGGILSSAGNGAYEVQRAIGGSAHDSAFEKAVEEGKVYFKQCTRCGEWICPDVCWNAKAGLCEACAPDFEEDFAAHKAQAMNQAAQEQLYNKARQTDYASATDMSAGASAPSSSLACPACGAKTTGSKFCPECGGPLQIKLTCPGCGFQPEGAPKFCPECGGENATAVRESVNWSFCH